MHELRILGYAAVLLAVFFLNYYDALSIVKVPPSNGLDNWKIRLEKNFWTKAAVA